MLFSECLPGVTGLDSFLPPQKVTKTCGKEVDVAVWHAVLQGCINTGIVEKGCEALQWPYFKTISLRTLLCVH